MNCQTYRDIIAAHVDGELSAEERSEIEIHLSQCTACTRLFQWERKAKKILKGKIPRVPAEDGLREKVLSQLPGLQSEKEPLFGWLFQAPAWVPALALLLLLALPYFLGQGQDSPDLFANAVARYQNVTGGAGVSTLRSPATTATP